MKKKKNYNQKKYLQKKKNNKKELINNLFVDFRKKYNRKDKNIQWKNLNMLGNHIIL